jgi:hypothetical protein
VRAGRDCQIGVVEIIGKVSHQLCTFPELLAITSKCRCPSREKHGGRVPKSPDVPTVRHEATQPICLLAATKMSKDTRHFAIPSPLNSFLSPLPAQLDTPPSSLVAYTWYICLPGLAARASMYLMVTIKSRDRGRNSTPFGSSLLLAFLAGVFTCQNALSQPAPARPADSSSAKKEATPEPPKATPITPPTESKYVEDRVDDSPAVKRTIGAKVAPLLAPGSKFAAGDQPIFDQYYTDYFLSRWTQVKNIPNLPTFRKELRINHLQKAKNGEVHDHLNTLVLEYLNKLVTGNYHPVVQVNAVLAIGELNKEEPEVRAPPKPLPAALNVLLEDVQNAKIPEAVRVAAMVGIKRHIDLGLADEEAKRPLTAAMLKLVAAADPSDGATTAGREWIGAQAIETLGALGAVGQNNAVFSAMLKTLADNKLSISTRGMAAKSLGRLSYSGATGISPAEVATAVGQFLLDACNEFSRLAKNPSKSALPALRNWMRQPLRDAVAALVGPEEAAGKGGVKPLTPEGPQRTSLDKLQEKIEALASFLDEPKHEKDDLAPQVDELQKALEAWLKDKPQPK